MLDAPADTERSLSPPRRPPEEGSGAGFERGGLALAAVLAALRRRRLAILACLLLLPALAGLALTRITPRYTATAAVLHEPSEYAARELQSILRADPTTDAVMASQVEIARGLAIAERLADRLKLAELPEFNPHLRPPSPLKRLLARLRGPAEPPGADAVRRDVIQAAQAAIQARVVKASRVLEVGFTAASPDLAARAANLVAALYIEDQLQAKVAAVRRANEWLEGRIADLRREVRASDDRIATYRADQGLAQGVQGGLDAERISRINADLLAARNDLAQALGRVEAARGRSGTAAQAAVAPSVTPLRLRQEELGAQLQAMLTRLGPNHPTAQSLHNQHVEAGRAVGAEIARVTAAMDADTRAIRARVATLEQALKDAQAQQGRTAQAQIPLSAMERDAEASRSLLQAALERIQHTSQQTAIERPDARVISPALVPADPSSPRGALLVAASVVLGLLLGLLLAWLLELADSTLRSGEEVRTALGLPCLALVPELSALQLGRMRVADYIAQRPLSPFSEQLRGLRAGLWIGLKRPKVIAITAARPDEGKTTVALALARSAAMNGERVIALDCDVRQPGFGRLLGADAGLGLTDHLLGHATLEQVVQKDTLSGMRFIAAGSAEAGSRTLFGSAAMKDLLAKLAEQYDLVLLDAPPAAAMTDARIIAAQADTTLLLVRWHHTPRGIVRHAIRLLQEAEARIAAVALTRVDAKAHVRSGFADAEVYHPRYGGYFRE